MKARVVPEDLDAVVREAVRIAPGLKSSQIKQALPASYRAFDKEARATLGRLGERGEVYRLIKGKTEIFFEHDPHATLDEIVVKRLSAEPLAKSALKKLLHEFAPGHEVILDSWLKCALAQGLVYEHAPRPPAKEKLYAREPDFRRSLVATLTALRKALIKTDAQGISRQRVADALLAEFELSAALPQAKSNGASQGRAARAQFLASLQALAADNPRQALLSIRDLRARLALNKEQFDTIALDLMQGGKVSLHHHDHPASLPERERSQLVHDGRGKYYVGVALRRGQ